MKKRIITLLTCLILIFACVLPVYGCGEHEHEWGEYQTVKTATCVEKGKEKRVCKTCSEFEERDTDFGEHSYGEWQDETSPTYENAGVKGHKQCSVCNKNFDANGNQITDLTIPKLTDDYDQTTGEFPSVQTVNGKNYVLFGYYPQTAVTDTTLEQKINGAIANGLTVNSAGYYQVDGKYYAKMTAKIYTSGGSYNKFTDGTTIVNGRDYFFEVQPVSWLVVKTDNSNYTLITEKVIDVKVYEALHASDASGTDDPEHKPHDYSKSQIRAWLNGDLYNNMFLTYQKNFINKTSVSQGEETIFIPDENSAYQGFTKYVYSDTEDKIFLPSYADMFNADYGFSTDTDRMAIATDYVRASGAYLVPMVGVEQIGYAKYWLRSAGGGDVQNVSTISSYGQYGENESTTGYTCVRPMLVISNTNA